MSTLNANSPIFPTSLSWTSRLVVLLGLLLLPGRASEAQIATQQARFSPAGTARLLAVPARPLAMRERYTMVSRAAAESRKHRPLLLGALIGGAAGAYIGYENGKPESCPTYPGVACQQPRWGTATGAIGGAVVGGIVGFLFEKF